MSVLIHRNRRDTSRLIESGKFIDQKPRSNQLRLYETTEAFLGLRETITDLPDFREFRDFWSFFLDFFSLCMRLRQRLRLQLRLRLQVWLRKSKKKPENVWKVSEVCESPAKSAKYLWKSHKVTKISRSVVHPAFLHQLVEANVNWSCYLCRKNHVREASRLKNPKCRRSLLTIDGCPVIEYRNSPVIVMLAALHYHSIHRNLSQTTTTNNRWIVHRLWPATMDVLDVCNVGLFSPITHTHTLIVWREGDHDHTRQINNARHFLQFRGCQ